MSVVASFDMGVNFWQANPQFKVLGKFATFYKNDKSAAKSYSSKVMWAVAFFADTDPDNRLSNFSEKDRKSLIEEDYIQDTEFNWNKYEDLIKFYEETQYTHTERSLVSLKRKLAEREEFINTTKYSIDNAKDLDTIVANTEKLFNLYSKLEQQIKKDKGREGDTRGGAKESISDKRLI